MRKIRRIRFKMVLGKMRDFMFKVRTIIHLLFLLLLKYILAYTYITIVSVGGIFLFLGSFLNKSVDTTLFTNIGFGIFAVTANICFSWSRTFSGEQAKITNEISFQGERLLLSALCFLVASFFKYFYLQKTHIPTAIQGNIVDFFFWFLYVVFFASFIYAYFMAIAGVYELFAMLFRRHIRIPNIDAIATTK